VRFKHRHFKYMFSKIKIDNYGCWLWLGCKTKRGYAQIGFGRKVWKGHRLLYELFYGKIPEGLTIDHLCCVKNCLNPLHLEAVTAIENRLRAFRNKVKCINGHLYDKYGFKDNGIRRCRICTLAKYERYNEKRKIKIPQ